jgi:PKD repeat protein
MHRLASRIRTRHAGRSRGQSLVEFALFLPIIMLLTLAALDFGRIYLGYINIQNMARIAANFAANHPDAWTPSGKAEDRTSYQNQILGDAAATNCRLPIVGGKEVAADPTFTDRNADGRYEIGDTAEVALTCTFSVITPVMSNIVGGSIPVSASAVFPVKSAMTGTGTGSGWGTPPVAAFTGNGVVAPSTVSGTAPFTVVFRDTSGGAPTSWFWEFPDDSTTSTLQDPLGHTFVNPGTFIVKMTATNAFGKSETSQSITVVAADAVDFEGVPQAITPGQTVSFTDKSTAGGTAWAWSFGAGEGTSTLQNPTHKYNTSGSYTVTLTVTYPAGDKSLTRVNYITVSVANCTVPSFNGVRRNNAQALWSAAGFTSIVGDYPGAPSGNYVINTQSVQSPLLYPCNGNIQVTRQP